MNTFKAFSGGLEDPCCQASVKDLDHGSQAECIGNRAGAKQGAASRNVAIPHPVSTTPKSITITRRSEILFK